MIEEINILKEFFDAFPNLSSECKTTEEIQEAFRIWFEEKLKDFEFVSKLVLLHLMIDDKHYCPHDMLVFRYGKAEHYQDAFAENITEELKGQISNIQVKHPFFADKIVLDNSKVLGVELRRSWANQRYIPD